MLQDHDEIASLLADLIAAYETNDRDIAAEAYKRVEQRLEEHFSVEERLFKEFAQVSPDETNALRADHRALRARLDELGVGVELHATRLGAIRELVQKLRDHARREDKVLYRWADRISQDVLHHGQSPAAPVR